MCRSPPPQPPSCPGNRVCVYFTVSSLWGFFFFTEFFFFFTTESCGGHAGCRRTALRKLLDAGRTARADRRKDPVLLTAGLRPLRTFWAPTEKYISLTSSFPIIPSPLPPSELWKLSSPYVLWRTDIILGWIKRGRGKGWGGGKGLFGRGWSFPYQKNPFLFILTPGLFSF